MEDAKFVLDCVGVGSRYQFCLVNEDEEIVLIGQLRQMKPMCFDEIKWIRKIAQRDTSFERIHNEKGHYYIIRAGDGHELGRGNYHTNQEKREQEVDFVKQNATEAGFVDKTPHEERVRAKDYVEEKSTELLKKQGIVFG